MTEEATPDLPNGADSPVAWGDVFLGGMTLLLCLPAIFGCLGTVVPTLLNPEPDWSIVTTLDRIVLNIFMWSAVLAIVSPPSTLAGVGVGIWTIRRVGLRTAYGKAMAGIIGLAVLLTGVLVVWGLKIVQRFDAAGGQPVW